MNERQIELWDEFSRNEKSGSSAVYAIYENAIRSAGLDDGWITDICLVLQQKLEDSFFSEEESLSLYPMMYDLTVLYAKDHLEKEAYHRFCQNVYEMGARRWVREVFL